MATAGNTAHVFGGNTMSIRWSDKYTPKETEDADAIISRISNKLREGENESI